MRDYVFKANIRNNRWPLAVGGWTTLNSEMPIKSAIRQRPTAIDATTVSCPSAILPFLYPIVPHARGFVFSGRIHVRPFHKYAFPPLPHGVVRQEKNRYSPRALKYNHLLQVSSG